MATTEFQELTHLQRVWCMAILAARRIEDGIDDKITETRLLELMYAEVVGHALLIHQAQEHGGTDADLARVIHHQSMWHPRGLSTFPALLRLVRVTAVGLWVIPDTFRQPDWLAYYRAVAAYKQGEWAQASLIAQRLCDCHGRSSSDWFSRIRYTAQSGMPMHTPI